ncbi:MAG: hypothetical protein ACRDRO_18240 [Pseudonocardiaceae bacterium]
MVDRDFPAVHRDDITITLVEGAQGPLGSFPKSLRTSATEALSAKGVEIQSGRHAGHSIAAQISGHEPRPFHYRNLGTMAAVGRNDAIAEIGPLRLSGLTGWLAWLLVHIVRTVGVQARASVVISWISGYLFADRPVRLITGPRQDSPVNPPYLHGVDHHHGGDT